MMITAWMVVASAALATADASTNRALQVDETSAERRVIVALPAPPPMRLRCSLTDAKSGRHYEIEWEAGGAPGNTQSISLPRSSNTSAQWSLSCLADSVTSAAASATASQSRVWQFSPARTATAASTQGGQLPFAVIDHTSAWGWSTISYRAIGVPTLQEVVQSLGTVGGGVSGGRSLEIALSPAIAELFQILAEIAVDRARAGALRTIQRTFRQLVCVDLALNRLEDTSDKALLYAFQERWRSYRTVVLTDGDKPLILMPHTCAAVDSIRLQDLIQDAKTLYRALTRDAIELVINFARAKINVAFSSQAEDVQRLIGVFLDQLRSVVVGGLDGGTLDARREAQLLMTALAREVAETLSKEPVSGTAPPPGICPLALGFAAAAQCHASKSCDARAIADYLVNHRDHLDTGICRKALEGTENADLKVVTSRLIELMSLPPDTTPQRATLVALHAGFDISRFLIRKLRAAQTPDANPTPPPVDLALVKRNLDTAKSDLAGAESALAIAKAALNGAPEGEQSVATASKAQDNVAKARAELFDAHAAEVEAFAAAAQHACTEARAAGLVVAATSIRLSKECARFSTPASFDPTYFLDLAEGAAAAAVEGDAASLIVAFGEMVKAHAAHTNTVDTTGPFVRKLTRLVGGLLAFAKSYAADSGASTEDVETKRQARKQAIESVVEGFSDRAEMDGQAVVSIGVAAGFRMLGVSIPVDRDDHADYEVRPVYAAPSLPFGIALQKLPRPNAGSALGFHALIYPLDVAQFIPGADTSLQEGPEWHAFLSPGLQVGALVGTPEDAFVLGLDWHVGTVVRDNRDGTTFESYVHRLSFVAAYYVPLLDLLGL